MLPDEDSVRQEVQERFADDLALGARLISEFVRFLGQLHGMDLGPDKLKAFVLGTVAREIRCCRSIIAECELGLIESAEGLTRTLYEGMLSLRYVLDTTIPTQEQSPKLCQRLESLPLPGDVDIREFRLNLYVAKETETLVRLADDIGETESEILQPFRDLQASLPDVWQVAQRRCGNYSGLSIAHLAEYCGMLEMHRKFYYLQCRTTHANNALSFVGMTGDGYGSAKLSTDISQTGAVLGLAAANMFHVVETLETAFRCDAGMNTLFEEFCKAKPESPA